MRTNLCMRAQKARPFCHDEVKFSTLQPGYPSVCLLAHARMAASPVKDMTAQPVAFKDKVRRMTRCSSAKITQFRVCKAIQRIHEERVR